MAWVTFGYSVTPSLVGWFSCLLPRPSASLSTLLVGFSGALLYDLYALRGVVPPWYLRLRFALSAVAITSLSFSKHSLAVLKETPSNEEVRKTQSE
mmetsp:Transcript_8226/g.16641  ORF Transcript_8226/g.16641 Transcript_8226/m.16641 type:complete len:96 (+) Transcript_8226:585-872(+)